MDRALAALASLPLFLAASSAAAQTAATGPAADRRLGPGAAAPEPTAAAEATLPEVVVRARRAEAARQGILARFGAREYQVDRSTIDALPGGANQPLNQILLQTPGVAQDSFGEIRVRGEHRNLQYRLNGVALPESLSGFGQVFDARSLRSVSVLTGALPAQFGFRTNAVVNIETRTGALDPGGSAGVYGGSFGTVQPHLSWAGVVGGWDVFGTGTFLRSDRGIENHPPAFTAVPWSLSFPASCSAWVLQGGRRRGASRAGSVARAAKRAHGEMRQGHRAQARAATPMGFRLCS